MDEAKSIEAKPANASYHLPAMNNSLYTHVKLENDLVLLIKTFSIQRVPGAQKTNSILV